MKKRSDFFQVLDHLNSTKHSMTWVGGATTSPVGIREESSGLRVAKGPQPYREGLLVKSWVFG